MRLGNRCPSQSLPALAKLMTCSDFKLRAAAARAVQSAWAPGDAAALGKLAERGGVGVGWGG